MNKKMISIVSIFLIVILVVFLVSCTDKEPDANKDVIPRPKEGISVSMPQDDIEFIRKCGKKWRSIESFFAGPPAERVLEQSAILGRAEHEADKIQDQCAKVLFKEEADLPPVAVFMWTKVLNKIGDMANHAENVGDQFRLFVAG